MMRHWFRLVPTLVLVFALGGMSVLAASARGQVRAGGEVLVLCSGGGLVQVTLDENGAPAGTHLCPDLAPVLVTAISAVMSDIVRPATLAEPVSSTYREIIAHSGTAATRARDPPVRL